MFLLLFFYVVFFNRNFGLVNPPGHGLVNPPWLGVLLIPGLGGLLIKSYGYKTYFSEEGFAEGRRNPSWVK